MALPLAGLVLIASLAVPGVSPGTTPAAGGDVSAMFALLNNERATEGLAPLQLDRALSGVADEHARDMVRRQYFDHFSPEGQSPFARMTSAGVRFSYAGENLALDLDPAAATNALWNSPEHRANILGTHFLRVGIAAEQSANGEIFVEDFTD